MEAPKRKAEEVEEGAAKRPKVEPSNGSGSSAAAAGPGAAIAAPKKLGIDLDKLQKAKLALQKQKELQEKLKKAGITVSGRHERGKGRLGESGSSRLWREGLQCCLVHDAFICAEHLTPSRHCMLLLCGAAWQAGRCAAAASSSRSSICGGSGDCRGRAASSSRSRHCPRFAHSQGSHIRGGSSCRCYNSGSGCRSARRPCCACCTQAGDQAAATSDS